MYWDVRHGSRDFSAVFFGTGDMKIFLGHGIKVYLGHGQIFGF